MKSRIIVAWSFILTFTSQAQRDWDRMMDVNLKGTMHCLRAQLPHLPRPGGSIVNVASTAGIHGLPKSAAYSSSKHGVIGLTSSAAGEFGRDGIRINSLLPYVLPNPLIRDEIRPPLFPLLYLKSLTNHSSMVK